MEPQFLFIEQRPPTRAYSAMKVLIRSWAMARCFYGSSIITMPLNAGPNSRSSRYIVRKAGVVASAGNTRGATRRTKSISLSTFAWTSGIGSNLRANRAKGK